MAQDNGDRVIWFLAGAAIGATVSLLYAPQAGDKTRRMITRKAREGGESISESGREMMDRGRDLFEKGRRVADDAAEMFERGRKMVQG